MPISRIASYPLALILLITLALPIAAADSAAAVKPPADLVAEISIKSPMNLLQALDAYVAAATKKTTSQLPPGFLIMLSQLYLPLPLDTWNTEEPAQILILPATSGEDMAFVGVFGIKDFTVFVDSLQEYDWVLGGAQDNAGFTAVRPALLPNGKALTFADLGQGRAAVAENLEQIKAALAGGKGLPTHPGDADITVRSDLEGNNRQFVQSIVRQLDNVFGKMSKDLSLNGFNLETIAGSVALMKDLAALAGREIGKIREAAFDLYVTPKQISFDSGASFGPGSLLGEVAAHAARKPALDISLGERFGVGPLSVAVNIAPDQIVADAYRRINEFNRECVRKVFPAYADEAAALGQRYFELKPGNSAIANYLKEGRQFNLTLIQLADPEAAMRLMVESAGILDKMLAEAVTDPRLKVQLAGQPQTDGARQWWEFQAVFADPARWEEIVNKALRQGDNIAITPLRISPFFRAFFAPVPGALAIAIGELSNDEFKGLIDELQNKPAQPLLDLPAIRAVLNDLNPKQGSVGVVDAAKIYQVFATQVIQDMTMVFGQEHADAFRAMRDKMALASAADGSGLGFSIGTQQDRLTGRLVAPAAAVNTIIREHESFESLRREALRKMFEDSEKQGVDTLPPESLDEQGPEEDTIPMEVEEDADYSEAS